MDSTEPLLSRVTVGPPAHGGHCVARVEGRVVFVRHTAPGEVVDVQLTDAGEGRRFWRGDAVTIHDASPDRVPSRWPEAGPGGVGGGELAHLTLAAQRRWKAAVVRDTLKRIGHLDADQVGMAGVAALDDDDAHEGLGTRTRIDLVLDDASRAGMFAHRSHQVVPLTSMPLAVPAIAQLELFAPGRWDGVAPGTRIDVVAPSDGPVVVLCDGHVVDPQDPARSLARRSERMRDDRATNDRATNDRARNAGIPHRRGGARSAVETRRGGGARSGEGAGFGEGRARGGGARRGGDARWGRGRQVPPGRVNVREQVASAVGQLRYRVDATGFWQVHRHAPATLVDAVLAAARVEPGGRVLDLYSGAGLFTLPLALAAGERGRVDAVEIDERAVRSARRNLHAAGQAVLHASDVSAPVLDRLAAGAPVGVVVLDPPRSGAGGKVMTALTRMRPGRIVYVACDPAALARDLRTAVDHGYDVVGVQGYDIFPHTHHVECVAVLEPR